MIGDLVAASNHIAIRSARRPLSLREPLKAVIAALRDTRHYPGLRRFVLASYFYQDVLGTIVAFMAVYAVVVMGFAAGAEVTFFVVLTVPAVAGSAITGHLVDRFGPKRKKADEPEQDLGEELADVLFVLLVIANQQEIDLGTSLELVLEKYRVRDSGRWAPKQDRG